MSCPDENTLTAFAERRLDEAGGEALVSHLRDCPECLAVLCDLARFERTTVPDAVARERSVEPSDPERGQAIGRYTLLAMIGQGAMGSVYEAHDPELDRRVALKVLRSDRLLHPEAGERLSREARAMAKLSHPSVVTVHDAGQVGDRFFIAMELVPGVTLAAWLHERERLWQETVKVFLAAGKGLVVAHAAGIVHRDFKPENVLIDRDGRVAVTDFGLAAAPGGERPAAGEGAGDPDEVARTATGTILGTPRYMSPEQHAGEKVDARTDQFSFAVALYEGLYREGPFTGSSVPELREEVTRGNIRGAPPGSPVPLRVRRALLRALRVRPEDRYSTMQELLAAIEASARTSRTAARLAAVVAILAVGIGATAVVRLARSAPKPAPAADAVSVTQANPAKILILGVENRTADAVFDGTVEATLKRAIGMSTVAEVYARTTLRTLARELDPHLDALDERLGQELLARDGGRVLTVRGTVDVKGAGYSLSVVAKDARDGATVVSATREAADSSRVIPTLGHLAWAVRAAIGEAVPPDGPLAEQTGMSLLLEADHEYSVGHDLSAAGKRAEAMPHLQRAVALDPSFARAHWSLSGTLDTEGRHNEAECELALRPGDGVSDWERLLFSGSCANQRGDYDQAIAAFAEAVRRKPSDVTAEVSLGIQYNYSRQPGRALEVGRRAVAEHPQHLFVRTDLGRWLLSTGDAAEAAREAEGVLRDFPHPLSVNYVTLAVSDALLGRRADALDAYAKLRAIDPSAADAGLADLAIAEGRLDDAAAILDKAIAADLAQGNGEAAAAKGALLAEVRLRQGDGKGVAAAAEAAIAKGSRATVYAAGAASLEARQGTAELARESLAGKTAQEPRTYAKLLEAEALRVAGKASEALVAFGEAQAIMETWPGRFGLGRTYLDQGSFADAERELRRCVALDGGVANVFPVEDTGSLRYRTRATYYLGRALEGAGKAEARSMYEQFLALEPEAQHDRLAEDARRRLAALR